MAFIASKPAPSWHAYLSQKNCAGLHALCTHAQLSTCAVYTVPLDDSTAHLQAVALPREEEGRGEAMPFHSCAHIDGWAGALSLQARPGRQVKA